MLWRIERRKYRAVGWCRVAAGNWDEARLAGAGKGLLFVAAKRKVGKMKNFKPAVRQFSCFSMSVPTDSLRGLLRWAGLWNL